MTIETSTTRMPTLGTTRGQIIFRYNHKQLERENDAGEVETYWQCSYVLLPSKTDTSSPQTMVSGALNQDLQTYLYGKYDVGTQISFNAIDTRADTPQVVKDGLALLFTWISNVMEYYYGKKAAIRDGEDWESVTWDFSQFDATDPNISLESLMGPQ